MFVPFLFQAKFVIPDFMLVQTELTPHMRTILVDWLVEVQENFELNHETLYLAVKLVDLYLCQKQVARDRLQLVGATALFVACKFDVSYQGRKNLRMSTIKKRKLAG